MYNKDGDSVFNLIEEKLNKNKEITKQELVALTFTPIMGGTLSKLDKILKSIRIVKRIDSDYKHDVESMLYAFADKFLQGRDLEKVKEELRMTELGRMLVEEGIEKGKAEGKAEGKSELLIKQLLKKFKKVPQDYQKKIKELSPEVLETIAMDIFELENIEELQRYF